MRSLEDMRSECLEMVGEVGSEVASKIATRWLNRSYLELARSKDWRELRGYLDTGISMAADQAYLALPGDAAELQGISDKDRDYVLVKKTARRLLEDRVSLLDQSASPTLFYTELGRRATSAPLSVDDTVQVTTEVAGDSSVDVRVVGLRSSPEILDSETILTHASAPNTTGVDGSLSWREGWSIQSISVSTPLSGYVTVTETTDTGNVLAHIPKDMQEASYLIILLGNPPAEATNIRVLYKKRVVDLCDDSDTPVIPVSDAMVEMTIAALRRHREQYQQANQHDGLAQRALGAAATEHDMHTANGMQATPDLRGRPRGTRW